MSSKQHTMAADEQDEGKPSTKTVKIEDQPEKIKVRGNLNFEKKEDRGFMLANELLDLIAGQSSQEEEEAK